MSKQLCKHLARLLSALKKPLCQGHKQLMAAFCIAAFIMLLRSVGLLQSLEWAALDQFFQLRPQEPPFERITIVAINEASLHSVGRWPIPDSVIAQLLQKLQIHQPRAIGLDIYRDLPVQPGHHDLVSAYRSMPNLVGIEFLSQNHNTSVSPPPVLHQLNQFGFNNLVLDADGKVRRSLLYRHVDNQVHYSFALKLAKVYLKSEGITSKKAKSNPEYLQLGKAVFPRFQRNDGAYVGADDRGYQILSNFPKAGRFSKVSLTDVLEERVPESLIKDRIVLIGSTAPSLQDNVLIPYSSRIMGTVKPVAGIELQAYFISELIRSALDGRPLLKVWSKTLEWLWIFAWAYMGTSISRRIRYPSQNILSILLSGFVIVGSAYIGFSFGWWIPILPALLSLGGAAVVITALSAYHQEGLKRSKEFLHQVINTIPDPIFVKNEKHQWIVLNEAYCRFIGYPKSLLIEKSDYDFFAKHEADVFRKQDELLFQNHEPQEHEEEFTNASGKTFFISTKRSLHKDAAGNFFLVGVIRDITKRKQIEQDLKRAAAELSRSNDELKLKEDHLRYLAYHDSLTGLPNRKFFVEQLYNSLEWAKNNNLLIGLLFIDLDGFKHVNDTLGHEMGDRLLITIAQRLSNSLRNSDTVGRLGGDEFTVILRAIPSMGVAAKVAEKILSTIAESIVLDGHTTKVSASIGISIYPLNSQDAETLIKQADTAMYRAKHLGKNRCEFTSLVTTHKLL
ncbi:MAG: CHASE2 domain-containing protein [Rhizonema sp. PD38]|nr:CHASE2 domain-containing protein [Rhizonema sp. PD38]